MIKDAPLFQPAGRKVDSEWGRGNDLIGPSPFFSQKLTSDSDSSTQINFDQTLSNVTICLFGPYFSEENKMQYKILRN